MGYQPRTSYYEMYVKAQKEAVQLQVANNKLTAELSRLKENERIRKAGEKEGAGISALEGAEDALWKARDELKVEKHYTYGFALVGLISTPVSVGLFVLGGPTILLLLGFLLALIALVGIGTTFAKVFGKLPEVRRDIATKQRQLDRLTLKEMGIR